MNEAQTREYVRDATVRFLSSDDDNQGVIIGFLVPLDEAPEWHIGDKITVLRGDLAAHDQALREQIATEIERDIIPDLHDNKDDFCPDCWAVHEAARIARGEQA